MAEFPFTALEWSAVSDAALLVVNAELAGDALLRESHFVGLLEVLAGLRGRYGDHPVLLETEADFTEDDSKQIALYRRAIGIAAMHGMETLSIRQSLTQVLSDLGHSTEAASELLACEVDSSLLLRQSRLR